MGLYLEVPSFINLDLFIIDMTIHKLLKSYKEE